ncbi:ExbD/TolR family protein [Terriglobus sp. RCC_193]|uniref:ExbD/TolR family protein n=1 Tax=Terriglobus sp. RCC_193 TaxID=3239218 RepID=UPI003525A0B7
MQVLPLIAAFACVVGLVASDRESMQSFPAKGLYVALATDCPANMRGERRIEVVALGSDGRTYLNDEPMSKPALRAEIAGRMATRLEPIIFVRGDEQSTYGQVLSFASEFVFDTPTLTVAFATRTQAGPVNPEVRKTLRFPYRIGDEEMMFGYCLSQNSGTLTARGIRTR